MFNSSFKKHPRLPLNLLFEIVKFYKETFEFRAFSFIVSIQFQNLLYLFFTAPIIVTVILM